MMLTFLRLWYALVLLFSSIFWANRFSFLWKKYVLSTSTRAHGSAWRKLVEGKLSDTEPINISLMCLQSSACFVEFHSFTTNHGHGSIACIHLCALLLLLACVFMNCYRWLKISQSFREWKCISIIIQNKFREVLQRAFKHIYIIE